MKVAIVVLALVVFVQATSLNDDLKSEFMAFKKKHGKVYKDVSEELHRMKIYRDNMELIRRHNKRFDGREVTFEMGKNQFTDMSPSEFKRLVLTKLDPNEIKQDLEYIYKPSTKTSLPPSVDWRNSGAVNPVKNQGNCRSCWAFSAIGALESHHYITKHQKVSLSEQNLVDCTYGAPYNNSGCLGGWPINAYRYIWNNGGVNTASYYPYEDRDNTCRFNRYYVGSKISTVISIEAGNEADLASAVANKGPVSVCVNSINFQNYARGVLNIPCANGTDHCVVVDGYGTDPVGGDYWLVRNSWGANWGEGGYLRMARNQNNQCSIASYGTFPLVV